jgi:hypothetical protein
MKRCGLVIAVKEGASDIAPELPGTDPISIATGRLVIGLLG